MHISKSILPNLLYIPCRFQHCIDGRRGRAIKCGQCNFIIATVLHECQQIFTGDNSGWYDSLKTRHFEFVGFIVYEAVLPLPTCMKEEGCRSVVVPKAFVEGGTKDFNLVDDFNITTTVRC